MRKLSLVLILFAFALPAFAAKSKARIKVINQSKWEIHHLFLSSTSEEKWGPDQLGDEVIGKDESFTILGIPCDDYDVKIVDEEGDACVVAEVDICGTNHQWILNSGDLL